MNYEEVAFFNCRKSVMVRISTQNVDIVLKVIQQSEFLEEHYRRVNCANQFFGPGTALMVLLRLRL